MGLHGGDDRPAGVVLVIVVTMSSLSSSRRPNWVAVIACGALAAAHACVRYCGSEKARAVRGMVGLLLASRPRRLAGGSGTYEAYVPKIWWRGGGTDIWKLHCHLARAAYVFWTAATNKKLRGFAPTNKQLRGVRLPPLLLGSTAHATTHTMHAHWQCSYAALDEVAEYEQGLCWTYGTVL